jgi:signal transduction histidine kinase
MPIAASSFAATAFVVSWDNHPFSTATWLALQAVGCCFIATGMLLSGTNPAQRTSATLFLAVGACWYIGDLQATNNSVLFAIGFSFYHLVIVVFAHLLLSHPFGRLRSAAERVVIGVSYVCVTCTQVFRWLFEADPQPQGWGDPNAPYSAWGVLGSTTAVILALAITALVIQRWRRAGAAMRRAYMPLWVSLGLTASTVTAITATNLLNVFVQHQELLLLSFAVCFTTTPFAMYASNQRLQSADKRAVELFVALQHAVPGHTLERMVAKAVGDPTAQLVLDPSAVVAIPPSRVATPIEYEGAMVGTIVHDELPPEQLRSLNAIATAIAITASLQQSRARIVEAADVERSRLQRRLHDGAQHQLLATSILLQRTIASQESAQSLERAKAALGESIRQLRTLAHDIYPAELRDFGLLAAVETIAEHAPIPVRMKVCAERFDRHIENTAYFIIAECMANVYKHAQAGSASIEVERADAMLHVTVADDGCGGADLQKGTGLLGLVDRVAAVGGITNLHSTDNGTTFRASISCG